MHVTIINDCGDENAAARQIARTALLLDANVGFVAVPSFNELAAAGNLIDVLDAHADKKSAVLVNVAPRHGGGRAWSNGTPFCYFHIGHTLVVSTFGGTTLSLVKKLGLVDRVHMLDVHSTVEKMAREHVLTHEQSKAIAQSQFRSFDFVPRVAAYLLHENEVPATLVSLADVPDAPRAVWWVDNFGNVKTTLLPDEIGFAQGKTVGFGGRELQCHERLSSVPDGTPALIIGSSGLGAHRFLEVVVQGKHASDMLGLAVGDAFEVEC
jgi:hypothetical protein